MSDPPSSYADTPAPLETGSVYPSALPPSGDNDQQLLVLDSEGRHQHLEQLFSASQGAQPPDWYYILSYFVCFCCALPCGLIAIILLGTSLIFSSSYLSHCYSIAVVHWTDYKITSVCVSVDLISAPS